MLLRLLGPLLQLLLSLSGCSSVIVSRRLLLRHTAAAATAAALSAHPYPASAIVRGDAVGDAEAAAAGAVGLWIELSGCTVCRKDLPATCTGTLVAPDLVLSARHCIDTPASLNGTLDRLGEEIKIETHLPHMSHPILPIFEHLIRLFTQLIE